MVERSKGGLRGGLVVSINTSSSKGEKKTPVKSGVLTVGIGLAGDAHADGGHRQVSLLAQESIDKIRDLGLAAGPGDFAENITTRGMELFSLPLGAQLGIGREVVVKITQIGKECHDRCNIFYQVGDCVMPREGVFAEVLTGGLVQAGDEIEMIPQIPGE